MASFKAEKPSGPQSLGSGKKEPAKAPISKQGPPKGEQKPREPRKKVNMSKFYMYMLLLLLLLLPDRFCVFVSRHRVPSQEERNEK